MILIITHKQDYTADYLINILNQRSIPYKRFNCEDVMTSGVSLLYDGNFQSEIFGVKNFTSVWFRRTKIPFIQGLVEDEVTYLQAEYDSLLKNIFTVIEAKWLSSPWHVYRAENKLFQLRTAMEVGFKIPKTLVTTDHKKLISFSNQVGEMIVKPISATRSSSTKEPMFIYTNRVEKQHLENISKFDLTPCIFQEEISKHVELRVTVVGKDVFAASVDSQQNEESKVDWRRKALKFETFSLPAEIASKCISLVSNLGLLFGAIDLILSPDGSYTFLEINPNGQWAWIENETGLQISDAIIKELINKSSNE
ncbi:hypothetical protein [Chitinophaga sp. LS1]|uniref:hypothetical protein n=1 Tax=Chitinophaga sp. LS1 TaxID=3051176 RepID=UPI002AAC1052|nr:hypothetical protein [Chitinophaga sp. LS1]WPV67044.1 hypothetical protein QQL36_35215 [Chitinophaga sp. LS1]